jgi:sulfite exporter TauE/SafE/plastocyanin domain-containing protein/copper chaperone CopZ
MSIKKEKIKVYDMTCTSCEGRVERAINNLIGVTNSKASFSGQYADVEYDDELLSLDEIKKAINVAGYTTQNPKDYKFIGIVVIVIAIALLGFNTSGFDMESKLTNASYAVLFLVGILTSIHCVGMCGGIMLSQSIGSESSNKFEAIKPALLYNVGRVISYTILGGLIGAVGSVFSLSIKSKATMQLIAGIFMIMMGLNMAGFSLFRKFQIKMPGFACKAKNKSKSPFLVGILNGLMPCGPLQTMQLFALGTGSMSKGALSMFVFAIGTVPLMLTFGAISGLLSKGYTKKILKLSGVLVIVLGLIMGNRGLAIFGINLNPATALALSNDSSKIEGDNSNVAKAVLKDGVQEIVMTANNNGFTPNAFYVQKGIPVKWIINGEQLNTCNNAIIIPSLNKEFKINKGENIIEFTPGDNDINFSCWMGMINGVIKVVDNIEGVDTSVADPSLPPASSGPSCCARPIDDGQQAQTVLGPSIYGDDISKVPTDVIVGKAEKDGSFTFKGIGYELQPLIGVVSSSESTKLIFDFNEFDNPSGEIIIIDGLTGESITSFTAKKGINEIDFKPSAEGVYGVVQNDSILGLIEVVDNVEAEDLEEVRNKFLQ